MVISGKLKCFGLTDNLLICLKMNLTFKQYQEFGILIGRPGRTSGFYLFPKPDSFISIFQVWPGSIDLDNGEMFLIEISSEQKSLYEILYCKALSLNAAF